VLKVTQPADVSFLERGIDLSVLDSLRKGFSFFLMSMGVSTYPRKAPAARPVVPPEVKPK
jgi:hypothetical protein